MFFFFDQSQAKFSLANVFNAYGPGAWLEPRQGSMWQENTGVTPTTSGGQTIGLLLDQSQQQQLGPELVTNGDFSSGLTGFTNDSFGGWATVTDNGGSITISGTPPSASINFFLINTSAIPVSPGKYYEITVDRTGTVTGNPELYFYNVTSTSVFQGGLGFQSKPTSQTYRYLSQTSVLYLHFVVWGTSPISITLDRLSVREILGNHASQATAANRPTLQYSGGLPLVRCDSNDFMTVNLPDLGGGVFSSSGSVYFALNTGMSALHNQSIGTSYSAPIQSMDLYGAYIFPNRLPTSIETQLQSYCKRLAGI